MANEARVTVGLQIRKTSSDGITVMDVRKSASFQVDVSGTKGPSPGAITALITGTIVDLSQLTIPGLVWITSLDDDEGNYVEYGIYDPQTDVFYPVGEVSPGESWPWKFSRNLLEEYAGTGTGTTAATNKFMVKAFNASAIVSVEANER